MKIFLLKTMSLPKLAVLGTGLAAAILVATMSTQAADATPRSANCAGCHTGGTSSATTATPSIATPAAGATYTVAISLAANPAGGNSGYGIVPVAPATEKANGGNTGADLSFTATMTAPTAAGTYSYTVYTNMGSQATGQVGSAVYSITVAVGSTTPPVATTPAPSPSPTSPPVIIAVGTDQIHGPYSTTTDKCGICHRAHTAKAPNLLAKGSQTNPGSQSTLCLSCHDGTGAKPDVGVQYGLVRPVNNAAERNYYSHDAVGGTPATQHTQSQLNEFGSVDFALAPLNRHSECADCHNSHKATTSAVRDSTPITDGWDASGRLTGVSGVSVTNSATPGAAPTAYTFLDGVTNTVTREYQLCFKCHSGFTTLTSNADIASQPSKFALDKAVEFNPANSSFHPIEAAGKNQTAAMKASLAGESQFKLWNFQSTDTIRCVSCHASSATSGPNPPLVGDQTLPQAGSSLAPHTSVNRGILLRNYQDRVLKSSTDAYSAGDFALCFTCHGEAPFGPSDPATATAAASQTNFSFHSKHLTGLLNKGSGTDIDTPGQGEGNAICAECHFRLHSTTNKVGAQTLTGDPVTGSRLVNFAPNVQPLGGVGGTLSWTSTGIGSGSCTLTCHGKDHTGYTYSP